MTSTIQPVALTGPDAAAYIGRTFKALQRMREKRIGPASFKADGRVMYLIAELDRWLTEAQRNDSRSNPQLDPTRRAVMPRTARRKGRSAAGGAAFTAGCATTTASVTTPAAPYENASHSD